VVHQGTINRSGYFFQAMYMTEWDFQPIFKYESFDPNTDIDEYDPTIDGMSLDFQSITTMTYGFNYFFNDWTRLQFNYIMNDEEWNDIDDNEMIVQLQVKF
jgi:hypothetical protein